MPHKWTKIKLKLDLAKISNILGCLKFLIYIFFLGGGGGGG